MKRKPQVITFGRMEAAVNVAIEAVKEQVKVDGLEWAGDCCMAGLKIPGIDHDQARMLRDGILLKGTGSVGPHFQKYGLNEAALGTLCKCLREYGYQAEYRIRLD